MFKIKYCSKYFIYFITLIIILFSFSHSKSQSSRTNYFFTLYPSINNTTSYIVHSITPYSEHLTIDLSEKDESQMIKSESISDYSNNISSIIHYKKDYLIKTCFGLNKIVEIIPSNEIEKKYDEIKTKYIYSDKNIKISEDVKYCYSTIVSNPDTSKIKEENIIITYWVQINSDRTYSHKSIFFYPERKIFSKIYTLKSNILFPLNQRYPIRCTTFRDKDIFCSYYDLELNNQYVIETNKIIKDSAKTPSVYFVLSDFGQIKGKNMIPISLNKQLKSIFGGYYDIFLAEFSEKKEDDNKKNNTVVLYSFYRKSLHASLVPMFSVLDLFFGINIRDDYIETNMFNYLLEGNEMIFIFIYNNMFQAIRVDYSKKFNIFKKYQDFREYGYYSEKIDNCKNPKFMQSTYVNTTIKYTDEEKIVVNSQKKKYLLEKDIASVISCENEQGTINYVTKLIELPQCLIDLDELNNHSIHKINFYLSIGAIVYSIYEDVRLKSFRNVGILFYPIEKNYEGLIQVMIKLRSKENYIIPENNLIYYDITEIRFARLKRRYVPYFTKPFHLKYRLYKIETQESQIINRISSNICYFQIKFFPWDNFKPSPTPTSINPNPQSSDQISQKSNGIINEEEEQEQELQPDDICNIPECSLCAKTDITNNYNGFICERCDASELEVMIPDTNLKSPTYGACICNTTLGFKKDPIINTCFCQDDYAYYKTTNLCWPLSILENGPYYTDQIDDITEIPIYDDCYISCEKCSKAGNETNHNCDVCKDGFVHIDNDTSNCYNKSELEEGYHEEDKDKYIKCHENCISCTQKPEGNKQYCTECRSNVSYYLRENPQDEYFNCFSQKCDLNIPTLFYAYDINSHECLKDCENGVKPYRNLKVCLTKCDNSFPFLDDEEKKCYDNCEKNPKNKITNYDKLICMNEEECKDGSNPNCATEPECGNERKYKNEDGECVPIPEKCLVFDVGSQLCKICNLGYYPLKEEMNLPFYNCYKTLDEIIEVKNKSNYYLNETEKYWDECYYTCETCYGYGSENRQRCIKCKEHYYLENYLLNKNYNYYNNCLLELTPNENCTSSQIDMYKYHDFCHRCKSGYAFVNGFDKCFLEQELIEGPYYSKLMPKMTGDNRDLLLFFKVYYSCYKYCKSCKSKGDFYDNNCTSCIEGYIFDSKSKFENCINTSDEKSDDTTDIEINDENNLIQDSHFNTWFNLGNNSFYIYQQGKCYLVFYHSQLVLISSKQICNDICPIWNFTDCSLKKYERFRNITKEDFIELLSQAHDYSTIKNDINLFISEEEDKTYFQITNNVSPPPKNMSYIDLSDYSSVIKAEFGKNLLLVKADIKRSDTQSTQVEYQFFNPDNFKEKVDLEKNILIHKRRLNEEENTYGKVNIDLPVQWTEAQLNNINYLSEQNINAFDTSSEFYTDNCYQFTSSKGGDVFLDERKKEYYPDIPLCEEGCTFIKYNSDTEKVTCKCGYKVNSENYTSVTFVKNAKDEKFKKNLVMENVQSMKCVSVIFKWKNLKSNPGFIIMIIFLIIFVVSCILYYIFGGFTFLNKFLKKAVNDNGIMSVLKRSIGLDCDKNKNKKPKRNVKFNLEGDDNPQKPNYSIDDEGGDSEGNNKNKGGDIIIPQNNKKQGKKNPRFPNDDSFKKRGGYDNDSQNSSVFKNDPEHKKNEPKKNNNPEDENNNNPEDENNNNPENENNNNPEDENNNNPIIDDEDKKSQNENEPNNDEIDPKKEEEKKKKKGKNPYKRDKKSEGGIPEREGYEQDSYDEYLKNDPNFGKNKQQKNKVLISDSNSNNNSNNENEGDNNNPKKEGENKDEENISKIEDTIEKEKEEKQEKQEKENPKEQTEIKINKKKKKITDKISDGQKQENYSEDNSMSSEVLKGKIDDAISNTTNEKENKSLISEKSKKKKLDTEEDDIKFDGDISKINQMINDDSKHDEDIINAMDNNKENRDDEDKNIDENLNINNLEIKKEEEKENQNILKLDDINDNDSLDISKENKESEDKKEVKKKDKKESKIKSQNTDSSFYSKFSQVKKAKQEGYDNDSNILNDKDSSNEANDIFDLISQNSSNKANPPMKRGEMIKDDENKENKPPRTFKIDSLNLIQNSNMYMKSSSEKIKNVDNMEKIDEEIDDKDENNKKVDMNNIINKNDEIMPLSEFSENYKTFTSIYFADLKKHHIIYFSFCYSKNDINNIFLKISLFSISIVLYFFLNTLFMTNSKMANAYFDLGSSSPIYILINLILPYIICGIIILLLKKYILHNSYITRIIKTIQGDKELRRLCGIDKIEQQVIRFDNSKGKKSHRSIINSKNIAAESLDNKIKTEYEEQKDKVEEKLLPILPKYKLIVAIYFIVGFIFLGINWYLMTSFCAIYKNTGVKLIVNSFISLLASLIFPCILGLIPTLIGYLSKKLNNNILYKIYKTINKVI